MQMSQELIFTLGLFATVAILSFALSGLVFKKEASDLMKRLKGQPGEDSLDGPRRPGDVLGPARHLDLFGVHEVIEQRRRPLKVQRLLGPEVVDDCVSREPGTVGRHRVVAEVRRCARLGR